MPSFTKILNICLALSRNLPDVVFIGGVAVYLHSMRRTLSALPLEASHDADFMISFSDYGILKDEEEITPNPRLSKHQMIVDNVEFDVYVEKLHRLAIPYDEIFAHSSLVEETRVACLEHLLILKLEALESRGHSGKEEKDRRDLVRIGLLLGSRIRRHLIAPYVRDELTTLLRGIAKSSIFFELCSRDAPAAKKARTRFTSFVDDIV